MNIIGFQDQSLQEVDPNPSPKDRGAANNFSRQDPKKGGRVFFGRVSEEFENCQRKQPGFFAVGAEKIHQPNSGGFFHEENPQKKIEKKNLKENVIEIRWWICPDLRFCWFTGLGSVLCW